MKLLEHKVAIVTGATKAKGLGKAIALKLAEQGAKVVLTGRASSKAGVEANVAEIQNSGGDAMAVLVDVSNAQEVDDAIKQVVERFRRVDILINNAGVGFGSALLDENTDKDWDANYGVNVKGT
ncbi:MAG: SDR family NAD(P)-dependent oxidoreductase, partial [Desulfobacterales bacterium]